MIVLVLADAAIETVPEELWSHPSILRNAELGRKHPKDVLLDRSLHHRAMLKLKKGLKRGRPDIVHFSLLGVVSSPLYLEDQIEVYVHSYGGKVVSLGKRVRLPRTYFRFEGLMADLFRNGLIKADGRTLLKVEKVTLHQLLQKVQPSATIGFTTLGRLEGLGRIVGRSIKQPKPCFVIGGFAKGHFSDEVSSEIDERYSVSRHILDSHLVVARLAYELEKQLNMTP